MTLIILILIGAIAGWIGGKLIRGKGFGLLGNILVGIVGAVLGSWIFTQLGIENNTYEFAYQLAAAVFGSVLFILLIGLLKKK